jgi:hypothetical protein
MACDIATHDRNAVFRNTWATGTSPDDGLEQRAFESLETFETHLILKLTGPLAGWELLDNGSSLTEPSVDFVPQGADDTALDVYIYFLKSNKLGGARRRDSQPLAPIAESITTVKSAGVHTDGDPLWTRKLPGNSALPENHSKLECSLLTVTMYAHPKVRDTKRHQKAY